MLFWKYLKIQKTIAMVIKDMLLTENDDIKEIWTFINRGEG